MAFTRLSSALCVFTQSPRAFKNLGRWPFLSLERLWLPFASLAVDSLLPSLGAAAVFLYCFHLEAVFLHLFSIYKACNAYRKWKQMDLNLSYCSECVIGPQTRYFIGMMCFGIARVEKRNINMPHCYISHNPQVSLPV